MEATAVKGVWKVRITDQYYMLVDTNTNIITVMTPRDNPVKYQIEDGIAPSDIEKIREQVIKNFNLNSSQS